MPTGLDPSSRYQLHGEIAHGGMGAILKGHDVDLGRDIAVKVLLETHRGRAEFVQRFVEEAQIAGQLQHPGVVPVYELGQFPDKRPYFTMKLVKGQTLARLLAERADPGQDRPRFLKVFEQVCQTLAYAHARGVIHRDLKPSNIMVGAFGEVQVMDWGLAKVLGEGGVVDELAGRELPLVGDTSAIRTVRSGSAGTPVPVGTHTQAGQVMGTPAYMPPEQAVGDIERVDERCDVFGLGAMLCEILTGRPPYVGTDSEQVWRRATCADLADAFARLDDCGADAELIGLAKRCLAPAPKDRPRNASVLAGELTAYLESIEARLRQVELERAAAQVKAAEERKRRRLTVGLATVILALVLLGSAGWAWIEHDRATRRSEERSRAREIETAVTTELERATQLREEARRKPAEASTRMALALASARRAEGMLEGGHRDEQLRARVAAVIADLQQQERDRQLLARLEEARLYIADSSLKVVIDGSAFFDDAVAEPLFAAAFREYGIDVKQAPVAEVVQRLSAHPGRGELAAALDDWARATRDHAGKKKLTELARTVDGDPLRNRVRDARQSNDLKAMVTLASAPESTSLPASTVVLLAKDLRWGGAVPQAVALLRRALRQRPDHFWLNHELALSLEQLPTPPWEEVVRLNSIAAALRPRSSASYSNLGTALLSQGNLVEAVTAFRRAIELDPHSVLAHTWLGSALIRQGKLSEAVASCQKAVKLRPNFYMAWNILGDALRAQGKHAEAIAACRKAITLQPRFAEAHNNLGNALQLEGKPREAEAAYRQALKLAPSLPVANANLGLFLEGSGALDEAIPLLRKATTLPARGTDRPDLAHIWVHLGNALGGKGRLEEAAQAYALATQLQPDLPMPWYKLGIALQGLGKRAEALAAFRNVVARQADHAESHLNIGALHLERAQWDDAIASFRKAIASKKDYVKAHHNLGFALRKKGRLDEAAVSSRRAIELRPDYPEAHVNLGLVLLAQRKFSAAREALRRGHTLGVKVPGWSLPSAKWLEECERLVKLEDRLPVVLKGKAEPDTAAEWRELALFAHIHKQLYGDATRLWVRALKARPELGVPGWGQGYSAACAAALAGSGQGEDAAGSDARERAQWRKQAREWLRAELTVWSKLLESGPRETLPSLSQTLRHWQADTDLAGIRDREALARLPKEEQEECRNLWAEVAGVLKKAEGK
jgi:serine/threonine-protein kinase